MRRFLALTSAAALSLFCAACGGDDTDDSKNPGQFANMRSNVTGTHPVLMAVTLQGSPDSTDSIETQLVLTEDAKSDRLNVDLLFFDCDLTATMTGATTFSFNPGTCTFPIPEEAEMECAISFDVTGGTGEKASADARIGATLNGNYKVVCPELGMPINMPMTLTLTGT